ncbi:transcription factor Pcc1-domain-containing protein [Morchella snyderi]|nr:transcription factor Pcc1-domain-containing protein [Morchella snyderi]
MEGKTGAPAPDPEFPHSLTISLPVPSWRIAETIQRALAVDKEISPYVQREFEVPNSDQAASPVVLVHYKATTARMLRVSTNGIFESLGTVLRVCEELDEDVLERE